MLGDTVMASKFEIFFFDKPIQFHSDLIDKIKEAVPYIRNVPNEKIRTSYKDTNIGVFIAIPPDNDLVLHEGFRNAYECDAETFKRLELEVSEIDSPFMAKTKREERVSCVEKRETRFDTTTTNVAEQEAHLPTPSVRRKHKSQNTLF